MQEMDPTEKFLFDLQGYLVVPGVLGEEELDALNRGIDANLHKIVDDDNSFVGDSTTLPGERKRDLLRGLLTLERPWCDPFRELLVHPPMRPYLNTLLGPGWRIDHSPVCFLAEKGAEGLVLHGIGQVRFGGAEYYQYANGVMRCGMIAVEFALVDEGPGDGGFCCIPGSHKANLPAPKEILEWEEYRDVVCEVPLKAGDMLIFNEATIHGTLPWTASHQRRTLLYRYSPKYLHYAGGHYRTEFPDWLDELTEAQRAVLEPPYIYNHPVITDEGEVVRPRRS